MSPGARSAPSHPALPAESIRLLSDELRGACGLGVGEFVATSHPYCCCAVAFLGFTRSPDSTSIPLDTHTHTDQFRQVTRALSPTYPEFLLPHF